VAFLAGGRPFFPFGVTTLAGLVCEVFAKAFDLAARGSGVAFGTVFQGLLMGLVLESDAFLQFYDISGEGGSSEGYQGKQGDNGLFHFFFSLLVGLSCPIGRLIMCIPAVDFEYYTSRANHIKFNN
jgi:hypothetical protein